jgi:hypothetical protein
MAGLDPATHVLLATDARFEDVAARDKPGQGAFAKLELAAGWQIASTS